MKKLFVFVALLWCACAFADSRSQALLSGLSAKIGGYHGYAVKFRVQIQGQVAADGDYMVSGNKFYIKVGNREIYCDGATKYEVNGDDQEVVIDNVNPNDKDILSNPTKAFEFLGGNFTHTYSGQATPGGKQVDVVLLKPTAKNTPYNDITLMIDVAGGLPVSIKYSMAELSSQVNISVLSFVAKDLKASQFTFDKGLYKGFELIDFR